MLAFEATVSAISYIALTLLLGQLVAAGFLLPQGQAADTAHCAVGLGESLVAGLSLRGIARPADSRRETPARLSFNGTPLALSDHDPERQNLVCPRSLRRRVITGNLAANKNCQPQAEFVSSQVWRFHRSLRGVSRVTRPQCATMTVTSPGIADAIRPDRHGALGRRIGRPVADFYLDRQNRLLTELTGEDGEAVFPASPRPVRHPLCHLALIKAGYT